MLTALRPQILWCQFLKFKETELPAKEADKTRSKGIYQSLEVSGAARGAWGRFRAQERAFWRPARPSRGLASRLSLRAGGWAGWGPGGLGGWAPPPLCRPRPEFGSRPQGAVQAGQLKVPPGYHPLDVEKEWGKLHVAILEREKLLRSEFERWVAPEAAVAGGALRWQGSHPRMSHRLGRKSPPGCKPTLAGGTLGCRPAGRPGAAGTALPPGAAGQSPSGSPLTLVPGVGP